MTLMVPFWAIPCILTVIVWTVAICWPVRRSGGDYNFGEAFDVLAHGVLAIITTLVVWLIYFILV